MAVLLSLLCVTVTPLGAALGAKTPHHITTLLNLITRLIQSSELFLVYLWGFWNFIPHYKDNPRPARSFQSSH